MVIMVVGDLVVLMAIQEIVVTMDLQVVQVTQDLQEILVNLVTLTSPCHQVSGVGHHINGRELLVLVLNNKV
tara:strand:+ start:56 stop:271 length:216 start_codon:yes stop_codon:yes gene_type:complete